MLPTSNRLQIERHTHTETEVMEKDISCKGSKKKAEVAILIPDKDCRV